MDGFLQRHSWEQVLFPIWAGVGGDNCCFAYRSAHRCEICLQTSGWAEETFLKKMSRSAHAEGLQEVLPGSSCRPRGVEDGVWILYPESRAYVADEHPSLLSTACWAGFMVFLGLVLP